ncbi:MAG: hypothetical protein COA78_20285 [Blastopirellula sp.]|nr:MAG: hypothetical protein COA78_20285 [Blastopirellula sp.]
MAAPSKSKRPISRPLIPPPTSPKPTARPDVRKRETTALGNVEFEADFLPLLETDPIAKLGFDPDKGQYLPSKSENAFYVPNGMNQRTLDSVFSAVAEGGEVTPDDVVMLSPLGSSKEVWAHEYRHRGLGQLLEYFYEDPEFFIQKYGSDTARVLVDSTLPQESVGEGPTPSERLNEVWDTNANFVDSKGVNRHAKKGLRYSGEFTETMSNSPEYTNAAKGLEQAAKDMMEGKGDVPKVTPKYAEGGSVKDQMEFAFMGDKERKMRVDPVSGNDIPPGSSAEEVRDDIDVKLSAGEYVLPADVVQYYGMKYLEGLRDKAKEAMSDMEDNGRMGGEPVQEDSQDELPFSDEDLEYDDEPMGMAEGGIVAPGNQVSKVYVNDQGAQLTIFFVNGVPTQPIPPGFYLRKETAFKSTRPDTDRERVASEEEERRNTDPAEWAIDDFVSFTKQGKVLNTLTNASALLGPGGMLIGSLIRQGNRATGSKALEEIKNRLDSGTLSDEEYSQYSDLRTTLEQQTSSDKKDKGLLGGLLGDVFGNTEGGLWGMLTRSRDKYVTAGEDRNRTISGWSNPSRSSSGDRQSSAPVPSSLDSTMGGYREGDVTTSRLDDGFVSTMSKAIDRSEDVSHLDKGTGRPMKDGGLVRRRK